MVVNAECAKNSLKSRRIVATEQTTSFVLCCLVLRQLLVYGLPRFHVVSEVVVCYQQISVNSVANMFIIIVRLL